MDRRGFIGAVAAALVGLPFVGKALKGKPDIEVWDVWTKQWHPPGHPGRYTAVLQDKDGNVMYDSDLRSHIKVFNLPSDITPEDAERLVKDIVWLPS